MESLFHKNKIRAIEQPNNLQRGSYDVNSIFRMKKIEKLNNQRSVAFLLLSDDILSLFDFSIFNPCELSESDLFISKKREYF